MPVAQAAVLLARDRTDAALGALRPAAPFERGTVAALLPIYFRGEARRRAGAFAEAARDFHLLIDSRGAEPFSSAIPMARLGLARALAAPGDAAGSRRAYQDLIEMWRNADPDLPVLLQARAEAAALRSNARSSRPRVVVLRRPRADADARRDSTPGCVPRDPAAFTLAEQLDAVEAIAPRRQRPVDDAAVARTLECQPPAASRIIAHAEPLVAPHLDELIFAHLRRDFVALDAGWTVGVGRLRSQGSDPDRPTDRPPLSYGGPPKPWRRRKVGPTWITVATLDSRPPTVDCRLSTEHLYSTHGGLSRGRGDCPPLPAAAGGLHRRPQRAREAGRRARREVKALQKPPVAAWAINQLFWQRRDVYDRLIGAAGDLPRRTAAVLAGKSGDVRAAGKSHEEAIEAALKATLAMLRDAGQPATDATRQAIATTLRALPGPSRRASCPKTLQPVDSRCSAGLPVGGRAGGRTRA